MDKSRLDGRCNVIFAVPTSALIHSITRPSLSAPREAPEYLLRISTSKTLGER